MDTGFSTGDDVEVFTHVRLDNNRWLWHQEALDKKIPGTEGKAPKDASPWLVLTFNSADGENYGRGRVEEFLGDLRSLEALAQALVEGSAAAAKVAATAAADLAKAAYIAEYNALAKKWNAKNPKAKVALKK